MRDGEIDPDLELGNPPGFARCRTTARPVWGGRSRRGLQCHGCEHKHKNKSPPARGYSMYSDPDRHQLRDKGTILENVLRIAVAEAVPTSQNSSRKFRSASRRTLGKSTSQSKNLQMTADMWVPGHDVSSPPSTRLHLDLGGLSEKDEHPGPNSLVRRCPQPSAWGLIIRNYPEPMSYL